MKKLCALILLGGIVLPCASQSADFKQAKFTQIVNNVEVISSDEGRHPAGVNDVFKMPDVLRTGPASRAELVADDNTITRVGANTIFSFDPASRTIDLQQGSLLFHSPHGKGGGTIHTGSATASVLGTTIIVVTTPDGGFKVLVLEGEAEIRFLNGLRITLTPGQMTFVLPGGGTSPIVVFRLDDETQGSLLVTGFNNPLPSWLKIDTEITRQLLMLLNNKLQDVDLVVGDNATPNAVQVRMAILTPPPPPPPPTAFDTDSSIIGTDHTPHQPLPVDYPPLNPAHVEKGSFSPPNIPSFSEGLLFLGIVNPASGFVGKNVDIDTANVDLSSYADKPDFDIMAAKDLRIWQSVNFTPDAEIAGEQSALDSGQPDTISLFAGGQMLIAPDSTLEADTGTFGLVADSFGTLDTDDGTVGIPNTLENVSVYNNVGDVDVLSLSDLTIEGMNSDYTVYAGGSANIQSDGTLSLGADDSVVRLDDGHDVAIVAGGDVTLTAGFTTGGDINVEDTEIYAGDTGSEGHATYSGGSITLNAVGNVYIDYDSLLYAYGGEAEEAAYSEGIVNGDVDIYAGGDISIYSSTIYADGDVDIEADGALTIGEDPQYYDVLITAGGDATLSAGGNVSIYDIYVDAGGDVDISSSGSVSVTADSTVSGGGNVDVEDSDIYAGDNVSITPDLEQSSFTGGSVNINADDGNVTLNDDGIEAYSGESSGSGNVNVYGSGTVDVENTYIYADVNVKIESGDTLTLGQAGYDEIDAYGSVSLTSDNSDAHVDNYGIYAYGGDITLTANNGAITVGNSTLAANGSVYLSAGGDIDINDSVLSATTGNAPTGESEGSGDEVSVSGGGTVTIDGNYGDNGDYDYDIGADATVFIQGSSEVDVYDAVIKTLDGSLSDVVEIDSGGDVTLDSTEIDSGGDVNINSGGTVSVSGISSVSGGGNVIIRDYSDVNAGGSFNVNAAGNIDITYSAVEAGNTADLTAGGYVNIYDVSSDKYGDNLYMDNWNNVTAGTYVDIGADANVQIYNSTIYADGGDVDINAYYGTADIEGTYIQASGNVNIESWDTLTLGNSGVGVLALENYNGDTILAGGGVNLTSGTSDVDVYESGIYALGGDVDITAAGNVNVADTVNIYATGDVNINSEGTPSLKLLETISGGGTVDIENSYINAGYDYDGPAPSVMGGSVNINAYNGDVYLYGDGIYAYGGVSTESGNVNIYGSGAVDVEGSTFISADNNATLIAGRSVTVSDSIINANDGNLTINAGNGGIETTSAGKHIALVGKQPVSAAGHFSPADVGGSSIIAFSGDVDITENYGNGDFFITISPISADLTISEDHLDLENDFVTDPGLIDLIAVNTVTVNNSTLTAQGGHVGISGGGIVNISGSSIYADAGYADITSSGSTVDIEGTYIDASGDVNAESSDTLTLGNTSGNEIYASGAVSLKSDNGDVDVYNYNIYSYGANGMSVSAAGNVNLGSDDIEADGGNVSITALGTMDIEGTYIYANGDVNVESSDALTVGFTSGDTIDANGAVSLKSDNGDADVYDYNIYSYGANGTSISAVGNVLLNGDDIEAYDGGDVEVAALGTSSTVDIGNTYIYASGDVKVESGGTLTLGETPVLTTLGSEIVEADGSVYLTSDSSDVDVYNYQVYAYDGTVSISAAGNADVEGNDIEADYGDVSISANGNVIVDNNQIYAYDGGDININSKGTVIPAFGGDISGDGYVDLENNSEIYAYGGGVYISAYGYVYSLDNDIEADSGNLEIDSFNSTIDIDDTYLFASGDVMIESSGTLTLGSIGTVDSENDADNEIEADGSIYLTSDHGDVDIYNYSVYAYGGLLSISAVNGSVDIENSTLGAGSDSNISISGSQGSAGQNVFMTAFGGNIEINAGNSLTILNTTFDLGGDISISGSSTITAGNGDVDITTSGLLSISDEVSGGELSVSDEGTVEGTVNISGNKVLGDNICISDSIVTANNGSVNIDDNGGYSLPDPAGFDLSSAFNVKVSGGSAITANSGNVNILTAGVVDLENSTVSASGSAGTTGNVTVNAGAGITVNGASIGGDATAGTIALNNTSGQTTVQNGSSMQAFYLNVNSPDGILLDGTSGGSLKGNTMNLTSGNAAGSDVVAVTHEDLSTFQSVNINGHTLDIEYTTFAGGSSVNLGSSSGNLNINNGVHSFDINLIQDNYGSTAITSSGQFTSGYSTSAGLHNYSIP